jgi:hypothetical protein
VSRTFAPAATKPLATIRPIPRDPPVINTFLPDTENKEERIGGGGDEDEDAVAMIF